MFFDEAACGLLLLAADGTVAAANRTFAHWLGVEASDLVGRRRFDELLTAAYRIYYETHCAPLLHLQGAMFEIALDFLHRNGCSLPAFVNAVEKLDAAGNLELVHVAVFKAHDRRAYERELMLGRRQSEQAVKAKADFLAMFAHELRNPLAAVLMELELLQRRTPTAARERFTRMRTSLQRVLSLLNNMLDISRLEAGKLGLDVTELELADVMQAVVHTLRPLAIAKQLPLQVVVDEALPKRLQGDPVKLGQALTNLVGNAIKFTEHGSITVGAKQIGESGDLVQVQLWVEDTGIGIAADRQAQIFEAYVQADPRISRQFGGTGLGLAITAKLVELLGGTLSLQSEPGRGSRFWFDIPMRRSS